MSRLVMSHFTVLTDDVPGTVRFYQDVLGLQDGPRPPLAVPGAWLYAGGKPVLHVVGGRPRAELKAGVIDHMAFDAEGLARVLATLERMGVAFQCQRQVGTGAWQLFFADPNGATVELDFVPEEQAPPHLVVTSGR
jgi:catechol 2,3-dioxygenase-like lactoylglutathione lyase family enzyme